MVLSLSFSSRSRRRGHAMGAVAAAFALGLKYVSGGGVGCLCFPFSWLARVWTRTGVWREQGVVWFLFTRPGFRGRFRRGSSGCAAKAKKHNDSRRVASVPGGGSPSARGRQQQAGARQHHVMTAVGGWQGGWGWATGQGCHKSGVSSFHVGRIRVNVAAVLLVLDKFGVVDMD